MAKIGHIINPYQVSEGSEDDIIQQLTIESLIQAKNNHVHTSEIALISVTHETDKIDFPSCIINANPLTRLVGDVDPTCIEKPLPLLCDIIQRGANALEADYYVYTNIDIIVCPDFYSEISQIIDDGHDAFVINRRRVGKEYLNLPLNNKMFSELGLLHNGYDCFVFKKDIIPKLDLGMVCIGIPHVGNTLFYNLIQHSKNFKLFTDKFLTYHIGYELVKNWGNKAYLNHNKKEFKRISKSATKEIDIRLFPGSNRSFFKRHFKWLMNPTINYPIIAVHDIKNLSVKRPKRTFKGEKSINYNYHEWLQEKIRLE